MKKPKPLKQSHTSNAKIGSGDYYGTGIKQKTGKILDNSLGYISMTKKALKKPPKSLA